MSKNIRIKPGKTQSKIGVIVGGIFVLIGIFVVIPMFGPFGLVWTLLAAVIMGSHLINATSDKGIATHEIVIEDSNEISNKDNTKSIEERLQDLRRLYDTGLITSEEYEEKRKQILEEL